MDHSFGLKFPPIRDDDRGYLVPIQVEKLDSLALAFGNDFREAAGVGPLRNDLAAGGRSAPYYDRFMIDLLISGRTGSPTQAQKRRHRYSLGPHGTQC